MLYFILMRIFNIGLNGSLFYLFFIFLIDLHCAVCVCLCVKDSKEKLKKESFKTLLPKYKIFLFSMKMC